MALPSRRGLIVRSKQLEHLLASVELNLCIITRKHRQNDKAHAVCAGILDKVASLLEFV